MKIKKLELQGFKSFKDRTVIHFDEGITGIVGPNGCGKSNIVDALIWVMGEQSAKHLRGSSMEDVIFAGSEGYAPMGFAEVSLVLENDGGPFPARFLKHSEIMVSRRLHRSGESEYLINKEPARLRDVQEIFMDTGVGAKGFSIIEQGAIGKIITAKPDERRYLIEEAAGITKFKVRKRESERKLAATDQNLLRLNDIVGEIKRQLDSLQRQAKKAERYRELKNQVKDLDLLVSSHKYFALKADIENFKSTLERMQDQETKDQAELQSSDANLQELKLKLTEIERQVHTAQEQRFEAQTAVQKKESELQRIEFEIEQARRNEAMTGNMLQELEARRLALEAELQTLEAQLSSVEAEATTLNEQFTKENTEFTSERERLIQLDDALVQKRRESVTVTQASSQIESQSLVTETRVQELGQRLESSKSVLNELENRRGEFERVHKKNFDELERERQMQLAIMQDVENFEANFQTISAQAEAKAKETEAHKDRLNQIESRLYGLKDLDANFEGFQEGVKSVMDWQKLRNTEMPESAKFALVADAVSVQPEFEVALEAALGNRLHMILSQNWEEPLEAIQHLKTNKQGRTSFFSAVDQYPAHSAMALPKEEIDAVLLEVVQIRPEFSVPISYLLERIAIVENLEKGLSLRRRFPRWGFVTRTGDVITADGIVTGGTEESADSGVVRRRREIKELTSERDILSGQMAILNHELQKLEDQAETLRKDLENSRTQKSEREILVAEKRKDLERAESELNNLLQAIAKQEKDVAELESQKSIQQEKYDACQSELESLREKAAMVQEDVERMTKEVDQIRRENESRQRIVTDLQVRSAGKNQERDGLRRQVELFTRNQRELDEQKARMTDDSSKTAESLSTHQILLEQERLRLNALIDQAEQSKTGLAQLQDEYEKQAAESRELEARITEKVKSIQSDQTTINDLRLKLEQSTLRESNIVSQVFEKYTTQLLEVAETYRSREVNLEQIEAELNDLKDKMSKMGEVSLAAIDEYDELTARYEFLTKQQSDLLEAQSQLRKVIDRIDKICGKQFKETFEAVNERFSKVFPVLFGGGMAHLVMIEDLENGTEPGIDIVVRPPGKKSQNITLLSGGEKALTSVALIFSIFLVKPSPFCLLDEVDAPLDDANVFRFNELVKEMAKRSQIIVVTHNKYTMEVNNKLYGVTMEERGVSKMVSVNLTDAQKVVEATA